MASIIDDAITNSSPTATTTPAAADNAQSSSSVSNLETVTPATSGVTTYKPTEVQDPSEWTVEPDQTVAGQLSTITDPNNPLMVRAKTQAQQASAERGLINSSMAATSGEAAMLDAALPIAQADAATKAKAAGYNVDIKNQTNVTNANLRNSADQFNAGQVNQASLQELAKKNEALIQRNSQAASMMSNATSAINNVMQNNQMDSATKTENMRQIYNNLAQQLSILSQVETLDLGSLLNNPYETA